RLPTLASRYFTVGGQDEFAVMLDKMGVLLSPDLPVSVNSTSSRSRPIASAPNTLARSAGGVPPGTVITSTHGALLRSSAFFPTPARAVMVVPAGTFASQSSESHRVVAPHPLNTCRYLPNGSAALRSWKPVMSLYV